MSLKVFKGDAADINIEARNTDITDYKIRAEIWDTGSNNNSVRKATANVTGGSDSQILITDAVNGKFTVYIDAGETTAFETNSKIEVEIESPTGKKHTVVSESFYLAVERISWDNV